MGEIAPDALVTHWRSFLCDIDAPRATAHPDDERHDKTIRSRPHSSLKALDYRSIYSQGDRELALDLLPQPFAGYLRRSKVILCALNPGLDAADFSAEMCADYRNELLSTTHQKLHDREFPNLHLNPEFHWTPGSIYWRDKLANVLAKISENSRNDAYDAMRVASQGLAILNLIPYHSVGRPSARYANLPSARVAKQYLIGELGGQEKLIVFMRSDRIWGVVSAEHCNSKLKNGRNMRFGRDADLTEAIALKILETASHD